MLSSCLKSDPTVVNDSSFSDSKPENTSDISKKKNIIHNFIAYKNIDLEKELEGIENIESVIIKNQNESSSLFISHESLSKKKVYRISSSGDFITLNVFLKNGSTIKKVVR